MPTSARGRTLGRRGFLRACAIGIPIAAVDLRAFAEPSSPAEILIVRHAEKDDTEHAVDLNDRGRMRADALPRLFESRFARPEMLIAARQSRYSNHAYQTIVPLSRTLGLPIDNAWANGKGHALARALLSGAQYRGKRVLICWHHESIPDLATALGAKGVPAKWRDKVYDRVWRLSYAGQRVTFEDMPQLLLPGDRNRS